MAKARPASSASSKPQRSRWAWIPNAVTSANLLLGFFSILVSLRALRAGEPPSSLSFVTACWLILWATIGDVLDGKLAKLLKASSDFGMRLDTFADAVTFGLAPAVLLYAAFLRDAASGQPAIGLWPAAYFLAACFRLARYNVASTGEPKFGFVGVPTPTAALIVTSLYLSTREAPLRADWVRDLCGLVAVSMIWPLRYPAFKGLKGREAVLVLAILFTMLFSSLKWGIAPTILVAWGSFALVWGYWWIPLRPYWVPGVSKED